MTARYTDAEKAAAKRIGYAPILQGGAPDTGWLDVFNRVVVHGFVDDARYYRSRSAQILRDADRAANKAWDDAIQSTKNADDARLVARAVAREQRKAARS